MVFHCHKGLEGYSRDPGLDQNTVRDTGFDKKQCGIRENAILFLDLDLAAT